MKVQADQRSREVLPAPAAERAAREAFRELARAEVKAARALATIERRRSHVRGGFASVHSWAATVGYGAWHANRLLDLGRTLAAAPELVEKVRTGKVAAEVAALIGRVLREPALELTAAQRRAWLEKAETTAPRALRAEVEKAIEEARQHRPTCRLRVQVTLAARDGFRRARLLMSKGQPRMISEGEAFGGLVKEWLLGHDPRLQPLPPRRAGPTAGTTSRSIPRRVKALIERRSGGICEVCEIRRATQMIHIRTPHARGGGREVEDLAHACAECHVMVDGGIYIIEDFDSDGRLRWHHNPDAVDGEEGSDSVREAGPVPYG